MMQKKSTQWYTMEYLGSPSRLIRLDLHQNSEYLKFLLAFLSSVLLSNIYFQKHISDGISLNSAHVIQPSCSVQVQVYMKRSHSVKKTQNNYNYNGIKKEMQECGDNLHFHLDLEWRFNRSEKKMQEFAVACCIWPVFNLVP